MKRFFLLAPLLIGSAAAQAQSTVTLYGRIDNGLQYETGLPGGHAFTAESGDWGTSYWGVKGAEDIGGGTQVLFWLESWFDSQNGQVDASPGYLFNGHAQVGVQNPKWGTFYIGNAGPTEIQQDLWGLDPQEFLRYSSVTLVRARNWSHTSNAFDYTTPKWDGLTMRAQYALTNNTGWNTAGTGSGTAEAGSQQGRTDGLEAIYDIGNLELRAIYDEVRSGTGNFDDVYNFSRVISGGGTYSLGSVRVYLGYQHLSAPDASSNATLNALAAAAGASVRAPTGVDHEWLGAAWQVSAAVALNAAVYHANANNGNGNATLYTLQGTYNLSKRTYLYAEVGHVQNSSTSNIGLGEYAYGPNDNQGGTAGNGNPDYGHGQTGVFTGIMTSF